MSKIYKPGELVGFHYNFHYKGVKSENIGKIVAPKFHFCNKDEVFIDYDGGWIKRNKRDIRKLSDEEAMIYILENSFNDS